MRWIACLSLSMADILAMSFSERFPIARAIAGSCSAASRILSEAPLSLSDALRSLLILSMLYGIKSSLSFRDFVKIYASISILFIYIRKCYIIQKGDQLIMKILIMSDSHGRRDLVEKCIKQHQDAEAVCFLGDVLADIRGMEQIFPEKQFYSVRGNCDFGSDVPLQQLVILQGTGILLTHGHAHWVNYGFDNLVECSRKLGAKIALYGHTHVPYNQYHDGVYVLNPGSIAFPRDGSRPSYGLIEITSKGILTNTSDFNQFK